jgi:hypothetical protein
MDDTIDVLVGLAALVIGGGVGFAAGRGWVPVSRSRDEAREEEREEARALSFGGRPRVSAAAAQDWARAEQGRPWESPPFVRDEEGEPAGDPQSDQERDQLVGACVDLADRLRDRQPALFTALTRDLAAIGVTVQIADGEPFDAAAHNAVGTAPASDPGQHLLVAETTRLGYLDHGVQVRVPDVIVYRWQES